MEWPERNNSGCSLWTAIGCSCVLMIWLLFPIGVFDHHHAISPIAACTHNLKLVTLGMLMYSQDYDERLPIAEKWMDETMPHLKNDSLYHCPEVVKFDSAAYGYAM